MNAKPYFGSTYLYEAVLWVTNIVKTKYRCRLYDAKLSESLGAAM